MEKSKVLHGLHLSEAALAATAKNVIFRDGAIIALKQFLDIPTLSVSIVSVSWSRSVIAAALELHGVDIDKIAIHANEIEEDPKTGLTTGRFVGAMHTSRDKQRQLEHGCSRFSHTAYIGDSLLDFRALLISNLRIFLCHSPSTLTLIRRICSASGIALAPDTQKINESIILPATYKDIISIIQAW